MSAIQELEEYLLDEEFELHGITLGENPGTAEEVAAEILRIIKYAQENPDLRMPSETWTQTPMFRDIDLTI